MDVFRDLEASSFVLDARLEESTMMLIDWPLCRVLLKNHADYPWLILVPRKLNLTEITALSSCEQVQLMKEVNLAAQVVQNEFHPDKLNLGALGNVVSQFHFHVVGRFNADPLWPQGVWQAGMIERSYDDPALLIQHLRSRLDTILER